MKRWRGGAAAASIAVALILPAGPARANEAPTVVITSPGNDAVLTSVTVSGMARMPNPLNSVTGVTVSVRSKLGRVGPVSCNDNAACGAAPGKETAFSFSPSLGANGPYEATVTAAGKELIEIDGLQPGAATRSFRIEAKPAAPQDVKAQANPDRSVTVTWGRNREVDLIGYQVQRRSGGSGFTVVDSVGQPPDGATVSVNDKGPAATGGTFEYVVLAVRPDRDGNTKTPVSTTSAPSGAVSVAGPDGAPPPGASGGAKPSKGAAVPASLQVSSFLAKAAGSGPPMVAPPAVSPPDGGFDPTLPLEVPDGELTTEGVEGDDEIALDEDPASSDRRNVLIPIAAGLLLCVTAAHLRWLNRRMTEPSTDSELPVWSDDDAEDEATALAFAGATPPAPYAQVELDEAPPAADARRSRRRRRSDRDRASVDTEEAWDDEALFVPAPDAASRPPYDVEAAAFDEAPAEVLVAPPVSAGSGRRSRRLRGARGDTGAVAETTAAAAGDPVEAEPADEAPLPPPAAEPDEARRSRRARRDVAPSPATEAALQALAARAGGPAIEADVDAAAEADARAHAAAERRAARAAAEEIAARAADKAAAEAAIADAIAAEAAARQAGAEAAAREAAAREAIAESVTAEARAREAIAEAVVAEASAAEAAETERAMAAATEAAVSAATEAAVSAATEAAVEAAVAAATMAATEAAVAAATTAATAAATEAAVAAATTAATDTATEAAVAAATTAATTAATEAAVGAATEIAVAAATDAAVAAATEAAVAAATEAATAAATETAVAAATQAAVAAATEAATAAAIAAITAAADFDNRLAVQTGPEYVDPSTGEPTAAPWTAPAGAPEPSGAWTDAPGDSLHWAPPEPEPVGPFSTGTAWAADSAEGDPELESSAGTGEPYWAPAHGDPEPGVSTGSSDPVWAEEADAGYDPAAGTGTPWVTAPDEATATGTADDFDADDADELDADYELEADGELDADAHAESEAEAEVEAEELDADADEGAGSAGEAAPEWEPDEWPRPAGATPQEASTDEEPDDEAWDSVVLVSGQPQVERE